MTACAAAYRATCGHRRKIQQNSKNFGPYQGRSDGGYWGGVVNPPNFFKINIFGNLGWSFGKQGR